MKKLLIATRSKGKLEEIRTAFSGLPFQLLGLDEVPEVSADFEVEEPAMTFEGNALIKAMTLGHKTGLLTLADDSGLEVDVLSGRPGVLSARFASGTDEDRYLKLLEELRGVPKEKRTAHFRCVIALFDPTQNLVRTTEGMCRGVITEEPIGTEGFGYDPVFFYTDAGKTGGQMTRAEKNLVSHRGLALQKAKDILLQEMT